MFPQHHVHWSTEISQVKKVLFRIWTNARLKRWSSCRSSFRLPSLEQWKLFLNTAKSFSCYSDTKMIEANILWFLTQSWVFGPSCCPSCSIPLASSCYLWEASWSRFWSKTFWSRVFHMSHTSHMSISLKDWYWPKKWRGEGDDQQHEATEGYSNHHLVTAPIQKEAKKGSSYREQTGRRRRGNLPHIDDKIVRFFPNHPGV